jgi:hypothetical protein
MRILGTRWTWTIGFRLDILSCIRRLDAEARKAVRSLKTEQPGESQTPQGNQLGCIACSCGMCNLGEKRCPWPSWMDGIWRHIDCSFFLGQWGVIGLSYECRYVRTPSEWLSDYRSVTCSVITRGSISGCTDSLNTSCRNIWRGILVFRTSVKYKTVNVRMT